MLVQFRGKSIQNFIFFNTLTIKNQLVGFCLYSTCIKQNFSFFGCSINMSRNTFGGLGLWVLTIQLTKICQGSDNTLFCIALQNLFFYSILNIVHKMSDCKISKFQFCSSTLFTTPILFSLGLFEIDQSTAKIYEDNE